MSEKRPSWEPNGIFLRRMGQRVRLLSWAQMRVDGRLVSNVDSIVLRCIRLSHTGCIWERSNCIAGICRWDDGLGWNGELMSICNARLSYRGWCNTGSYDRLAFTISLSLCRCTQTNTSHTHTQAAVPVILKKRSISLLIVLVIIARLAMID